MKLFRSAVVGAALVAATFVVAEPASARGNVGVYVGPGGVSISVDTYRRYCRDEYYRHRHWDRCSRFYGSEYRYDRYDSNYRYRHHKHRHWNRRHNRWDWD